MRYVVHNIAWLHGTKKKKTFFTHLTFYYGLVEMNCIQLNIFFFFKSLKAMSSLREQNAR